MNNRFPLIEVEGTHRQVGQSIGETMGEAIRESLEVHKERTPDFPNLLNKSLPYYSYTKEIFPDLIDEMYGIAEASHVDPTEFFFINNREVYDIFEEDDLADQDKDDHCTIAVSFSNNGTLIGHNEDWEPSAIDQLYLLRATIDHHTIFGLAYAPCIPGGAAMTNSSGLVQCINEIHQTTQFGVPKSFLARAVLDCQSLDEAEELLRTTKRASGYNHVLVQGGELRNIEIAGDKIAVEKVTDGTYVHTNHYVIPSMQKHEKFHTKSSSVRYQRACELIKQDMSASDMTQLLSDTKDKAYPICRSDATIASLVFDPAKEEVHIAKGHPCQSSYLVYNPMG